MSKYSSYTCAIHGSFESFKQWREHMDRDDMLSRKYYKMIAEEFNAINTHDVPNSALALYLVADALSKHFKQDNSNFNRDKFLTACGFEGVDSS